MMTMRKYISILLLFLCTVGTQAQKTVSGRVLNQDSVALQQATVLLYLANDSTSGACSGFRPIQPDMSCRCCTWATCPTNVHCRYAARTSKPTLAIFS